MARKDKFNVCFLCDQAPCICGQKEPKARKRVTKKAAPKTDSKPAPVRSSKTETSEPPVAPPLDPRAAMKAAVGKVATAPEPEPVSSPDWSAVQSLNDHTAKTVFDEEIPPCVAGLWPILHEEEKEKYREVVPPKMRAGAWKARRDS